MDGLFGEPIKKASRKAPDPIWDCVVKQFYPSNVPEMMRKKVNAAVADLKRLGATPESIRAKIVRYRTEWPGIACTVFALVKNWDAFAPPCPTLSQGIALEDQSPSVRKQYAEWKAWNDRTKA